VGAEVVGSEARRGGKVTLAVPNSGPDFRLRVRRQGGVVSQRG